MNKLNGLGEELLAYKAEFGKQYSEIIKKALNQYIDQMLASEMIDIDTHYIVKDESASLTSFKDYILTKPQYIKTQEQLFGEYEEIREKLNDKLEEQKVIENISTASYVAKEKIMLNKRFLIDIDYVKNYFGVENEEEIEKLMKRKGFVERFVVLRLPKIFKDFINTVETENEFYSCYPTEVFYDAEANAYGIYLMFDIPVDKLEEAKNIEKIVGKIKELLEGAEKFYIEKTQI